MPQFPGTSKPGCRPCEHTFPALPRRRRSCRQLVFHSTVALHLAQDHDKRPETATGRRRRIAANAEYAASTALRQAEAQAQAVETKVVGTVNRENRELRAAAFGSKAEKL